MLDGLADAPVSRFLCPDTLGVLDPYDTERFCRDLVVRYPAAFRFSRPQRLRPRRGQHPPPPCGRFPRGSCHPSTGWVSGPATRRCRAPWRCSTTGWAVDRDRRNEIQPRQPHGRVAYGHPHSRQPTVRSARASSRSARASMPTATTRTTSVQRTASQRFGRVANTRWARPRARPMSSKTSEVLGIDLDEGRDAQDDRANWSSWATKKELVTAEDLPYIVADVLRYDPVDNPVRILNYRPRLAQEGSSRRDAQMRLRPPASGPRPATASTTPSCVPCGKSTANSSAASSR